MYESVRTIIGAGGEGSVDWRAVEDAARAGVDPGELPTQAEGSRYAADVRDARDRIRRIVDLEFELPRELTVQNRHHWISANVETFRRLMEPVAERKPTVMPNAVRVINTGTLSLTLAVLGRNVLGQYDPLLLADEEGHELYFVHPNIMAVAEELDVDRNRFRRWVAFHEVTHAAEFSLAPWLPAHLEGHLQEGLDAMMTGEIDREAFRELDATMTAVEGYAELLMDVAIDDDVQDLRDRLDERRRNQGPIGYLVRRLLGLGIKRRQYERGREFFENVVDQQDLVTATRVWDNPENLPTWEEYDSPDRWLKRVAPDV